MIQRSRRDGRCHCARHFRAGSTGVAMLLLIGLVSAAASARPQLRIIPAYGLAVSRPPVIAVQAATGQANFRVRDISGLPGQPIRVIIETADNLPTDSRQLFIFSGIPEGVKLNPGGNLGDFWAVNSSVVGSLTLTAQEGFSGSFTVRITRSGGQPNSGVATMRVVIGDDQGTRSTATVSAPMQQRDYAAPPPSATQLANQNMLMARAKALFQKGDVAGARIIFEYLATHGSPAAAIAMGETFDPAVLSKLVVKGLESDVARARKWYEKAEELGSREARPRLNAMMAR